MAVNPGSVARALPPSNAGGSIGGPAGPGGFGGVPSVAGGPHSAQMSPLLASYEQWTAGRPYGTGLPRIPDTFLSGAFGPLSPIAPVGIDKPQPDSGRPEPRRFPMPVAWNMPIGEPGTEAIRMAPFEALRTISDTYSVARACIELRKNEIIGLNWDVVPTREAQKSMRGSDKQHMKFAERRAEAIKFFKRPDPEKYHTFSAWLAAMLEDIFVIDALSIYLQPSRRRGKGLLGSDLAAMCLIDGSSVRPLLDIRGGTPQPPAPAYQVYNYGVPRVDLMTAMTGDDVAEMGEDMAAEYRGDQMLYLPYTARDWTPYGFTPLEQALVPVLSGIQRQQYQLNYFAEGSVPGMFISAGNPDMTPNQLRELQDALNAMAGDPAWKHKIIVLPGQSEISPMRPVPLADQFDEIVMNQVCMAYSVMPMELGIAPKVSTTMSPGAANQMSKASETVNQRKALRPLLKWLKASVFDFILQDVCGQTDMEWMWEGLEEGVDEASEVSILVQEVSFGFKSIDEARVQRGEQPWGLPLTSDPVFMTTRGITPIGSIDPQTGMALPAQTDAEVGSIVPTTAAQNLQDQRQRERQQGQAGPTAPQPAAVGTHDNAPGVPVRPTAPPTGRPAPDSSSSPTKPPQEPSTAEPSAPEPEDADLIGPDGSPGHRASGAGQASDKPRPQIKSAALRELDLVRRRLIKGRYIDDWQVEHVPAQIWAQLVDDIGKLGFETAIDRARLLVKHGGHGDQTHEVYAYLARSYPSADIDWVKDAHWHNPVQVPLGQIQSGRRPGGAYDEVKVRQLVRAIEDGTPPEHPVVLVRTPSGGPLRIADGWHRVDAFRLARQKTIKAWIGDVDSNTGDWGAVMNADSTHYEGPRK